MRGRAGLVAALALPLLFGCKGKTVAAADAGAMAATSASPPQLASQVVPAPPSGPALPPDTGSGWQGTVTVTVTAPLQKSSHDVSYSIRGNRLRYPSPIPLFGHDAMTLVDVELRRVVVYEDDERTYLKSELPPANVDAGAFTLAPTGKTEKISGLECKVYEKKDGKAASTACIHEGLPFVDFGMATTGITSPAWLAALSGTRSFVLRASEKDAEGRETFRVETTNVHAGQVPGLFAPPSTFTERRGRAPGSPFRPGLPN